MSDMVAQIHQMPGVVARYVLDGCPHRKPSGAGARHELACQHGLKPSEQQLSSVQERLCRCHAPDRFYALRPLRSQTDGLRIGSLADGKPPVVGVKRPLSDSCYYFGGMESG